MCYLCCLRRAQRLALRRMEKTKRDYGEDEIERGKGESQAIEKRGRSGKDIPKLREEEHPCVVSSVERTS